MMETCPDHPGKHINFYCEQCGSVMCIHCKVGSHSSHKFIPLSKKCKMLRRKLIRFQRNLADRRKTLVWHRNNLRSFPTEKIKETIHQQYCNVKKWVFEVYQKQIAEIDNTLNAEQNKCLEEEMRINNLQTVDDLATELLSNYSHSSRFIQQSNDLLLNQTEKTPEFSPSSPIYVAPEEQYMSLSKDFYTVAGKLLGYCKKFGFETQTSFRRIHRCQSLVELPTFTYLQERQPPELDRHGSISTSVSSLPLSVLSSSRHRSVTEPDLREAKSEVYFCISITIEMF